jgi:hypothetical protein
MRPRVGTGLVVASIAAATVLGSPTSAYAAPDTGCMRAGIKTLQGAGLLDDVARDGLPIAAAVSLGVVPRAGTDVALLPDPLPLAVVLADHRAGDHSLFVYPWC